MIVDYYSRFPVVRQLDDMTVKTICNHFTSILAEFGLPSTVVADFGPQYISEMFKEKCNNSGIALIFSSPYHHQTNSLAERSVGICKPLWRKATDDQRNLNTALWMHRITPLDDQLPSPYELLFGCKPRTLLPNSKNALLSKHLADNDYHQEANQLRQRQQADHYKYKAGSDRRILQNMESVYVRNTIKDIWKPAVVLNRPNPLREPRTYLVDMRGTIYQRTREHLKPRSIHSLQYHLM